MSHIHWVTRQNKLEIPRDKDEVNNVRIYNSKLEIPKCRILFLFFYSGFCFYSFFRKANK